MSLPGVPLLVGVATDVGRVRPHNEDAAYAAGLRGEPVRTHGGRLVPTRGGPNSPAPGVDPGVDRARGRFARNAVIQGAAAEFFKAWVALLRQRLQPLAAEVVLCLHDEVLVHTPVQHAHEVVAHLHETLNEVGRWWFPGVPVRFVADASAVTARRITGWKSVVGPDMRSSAKGTT